MKKFNAFTMAEILLSLTIIGVVAAITLPSLTGNINERTWNTQRKALYARFSQAIALMPALNGYGTLTEANSSTSAMDTAAETFITEGLSKVLKINNICDADHLTDCGIPNQITDLRGNVISNFTSSYTTLADYNSMFNGAFYENGSVLFSHSQINTKAAAFETQNGESILAYYYPNCTGMMGETSGATKMQTRMCANFIYDLNGNKGPNTVGKDIGFITALYPSDGVVVAPMPLNSFKGGATTFDDAIGYCNNVDSESRLPTADEAAAMFYNRLLLGQQTQAIMTSSKIYQTGGIYVWRQSFDSGNRTAIMRDGGNGGTGIGGLVWCIRR